MRETLDLLGKVFQYRTCDGPEPGRASGSPCLDYYIKRCQAPCVDYISKEDYRGNVDTIIAFLSGRYRQIERDLEQQMQEAAQAQEFEQAALYRNRLKSVRSLLERQRISNEAVGTLDAIAVAAEDTDANAQVFQVRDGVLADRQSFYLENQAGRDEGEVAEEFVLQYYASALAIPPQVIVPRGLPDVGVLAEALAERRGGPVEVRHAERGDKRRIFELAERNARLALDQDRLRSERRRSRRIEALDGLQRALGMDVLPMRIECFDISNLGETHTVASMVVFEGGAPKKSDYRRFGIREAVAGRLRRHGRGALAPHGPVRAAARALAARPRLRRQLRRRPGADRDRRRQGAAVERPRASSARSATSAPPWSASPSGSRRCSCPGRKTPLVLPHDTPELQLLQRVRDEAHRFAIEFHRGRRDKAMTRSVLDDLPGVGPARKRLLLTHFGSPERFLEASREELEAVPGLPGKVAREVYAYVHKIA